MNLAAPRVKEDSGATRGPPTVAIPGCPCTFAAPSHSPVGVLLSGRHRASGNGRARGADDGRTRCQLGRGHAGAALTAGAAMFGLNAVDPSTRPLPASE